MKELISFWVTGPLRLSMAMDAAPTSCVPNNKTKAVVSNAFIGVRSGRKGPSEGRLGLSACAGGGIIESKCHTHRGMSLKVCGKLLSFFDVAPARWMALPG